MILYVEKTNKSTKNYLNLNTNLANSQVQDQ